MKVAFLAFTAITLLTTGCQKDISINDGVNRKESVSLEQSNDALLPLKCHLLSNSSERESDLTIVKEQYSDTRIKSLNLFTREFMGYGTRWYLKFVYSPNKAKVIGGRGEYYLGRKLNSNRDTIEVNFNRYGYATTVYTISASKIRTLRMTLYYNTSNPSLIRLIKINNYAVVNDSKGNIVSVRTGPNNFVNYTYNLSSGASKSHFYLPATRRDLEGLVLDDYYTLLEVMQWIPAPRNARVSQTTLDMGSGELFTVKIANHEYDSLGKLISYTFDNDERAPSEPWKQTLMWHCAGR